SLDGRGRDGLCCAAQWLDPRLTRGPSTCRHHQHRHPGQERNDRSRHSRPWVTRIRVARPETAMGPARCRAHEVLLCCCELLAADVLAGLAGACVDVGSVAGQRGAVGGAVELVALARLAQTRGIHTGEGAVLAAKLLVCGG